MRGRATLTLNHIRTLRVSGPKVTVRLAYSLSGAILHLKYIDLNTDLRFVSFLQLYQFPEPNTLHAQPCTRKLICLRELCSSRA